MRIRVRNRFIFFIRIPRIHADPDPNPQHCKQQRCFWNAEGGTIIGKHKTLTRRTAMTEEPRPSASASASTRASTGSGFPSRSMDLRSASIHGLCIRTRDLDSDHEFYMPWIGKCLFFNSAHKYIQLTSDLFSFWMCTKSSPFVQNLVLSVYLYRYFEVYLNHVLRFR